MSTVTCWLRKSFLDADHSDGCGERDSKKPMVETTEINYKENKFGPDVVIQLS